MSNRSGGFLNIEDTQETVQLPSNKILVLVQPPEPVSRFLRDNENIIVCESPIEKVKEMLNKTRLDDVINKYLFMISDACDASESATQLLDSLGIQHITVTFKS